LTRPVYFSNMRNHKHGTETRRTAALIHSLTGFS